MFFYLDYRHHAASAQPGTQLLDATDPASPVPGVLLLRTGFQRLLTLETPGGKLLLLGDPVCVETISLGAQIVSCTGGVDETALYEAIRGHYYWFLLRPDGMDCGTSFGAVFPLYYRQDADGVRLGSDAFFLAEQADPGEPDRRNLLERLLFHYPFFDSTWWTDIRLLGAHRHLCLRSSGARTEGDFEIRRFFGDGAKNTRRDLDDLTQFFYEECCLFLPDHAPFGVSFTGGFDGRTLLAAARKAGRRDFLAYSFGRPGATDVTFPEAQARRMGIRYLPIRLDADYVEKHALASARAFLETTGFNGNYGRPHYHYAARLLSEKVDYLVTGNFGSELFRALHQPGVMMSEALIRVFAAADDSWKDFLKQTAAGLNTEFFKNDFDALVADLEQYLAPMAGWEANHRFYHFVFNEIFRKYFGPELLMQTHFLNNRTPFLSLRFFQALNATRWAGVHSGLFEKQKSKRLKGQLFYAAFLRNTDRKLYRHPTNKGYRPADVLQPLRLPLLLGGVAYQKLVRKDEPDSNAVDAFWARHGAAIRKGFTARDDGSLQASGLAGLLQAAEAAGDMEKIIQYSSVAEGWSRAGASLKHTHDIPLSL